MNGHKTTGAGVPTPEADEDTHRAATPHTRRLATLAIALAYLCAAIALLSQQFAFGSPTDQRPILLVVALFAATFVVYLLAIRHAAKAPQTPQLVALILTTAVVVRIVFLFSLPIQEIDIYRYIWDGAVTTTGVSPFRFSPEQVRTASLDATSFDATSFDNGVDPSLQRLVELQRQRPALAEILSRIHYGELPTVYPPISQAVFAAATWTTPANASVSAHMLIMKAWLIGFDLATILLVIGLLKTARLPIGLSVIYAWCPLVLKEVANSGHLDAIAVFLTILAIYMTAVLLSRVEGPRNRRPRMFWPSACIAFVLALAIGAKIYPIVLTPLVLLSLAKRFGWQYLVSSGIVLASTLLLVFSPWLMPASVPQQPYSSTPDKPASALASVAEPIPIPPSTAASDPSKGVRAFLSRWEMNDFLFLILAENLRPTAALSAERTAWFALTPQPMREAFVQRVASRFHVATADAPFLAARAITAIVFILIAITLAWRSAAGFPTATSSVRTFCAAAFLTLAWFWLLCPTQNPWYWTWAVPLLPFARSRVWLAMSGLLFIYYLRFWFGYHFPEPPVFGTPYAGHGFFDFVITWCEFAPWFAALAVGFVLRGKAETVHGYLS